MSWKNILITDITSYKAIVVARYLKKAYKNINIVGTDHRSYAKQFHTKYIDKVVLIHPPIVSDKKYIECIKNTIDENKIEILIPINSSEIRILLKNKKAIGSSLDYIGNYNSFSILDDKISFNKFLNEKKLPLPKTFNTLNAEPPLVLKPTLSSSSIGLEYLFTNESIDLAIKKYGLRPKNFVIQQYIEGEGVGYSGFFKNGKISVGYAHRRIAEYPISGGSSVIREKYNFNDLKYLESLVMSVLSEIKWSGFAMFEFKRTDEGKFFFIECNPRIWGSINDGLYRGYNYFRPLIGQEQKNMNTFKELRRTELFPLSYLSLIQYFYNRRLKKVRNIIKNMTDSKFDINPFIDPLGFISLIKRKK